MLSTCTYTTPSPHRKSAGEGNGAGTRQESGGSRAEADPSSGLGPTAPVLPPFPWHLESLPSTGSPHKTTALPALHQPQMPPCTGPRPGPSPRPSPWPPALHLPENPEPEAEARPAEARPASAALLGQREWSPGTPVPTPPCSESSQPGDFFRGTAPGSQEGGGM